MGHLFRRAGGYPGRVQGWKPEEGSCPGRSLEPGPRGGKGPPLRGVRRRGPRPLPGLRGIGDDFLPDPRRWPGYGKMSSIHLLRCLPGKRSASDRDCGPMKREDLQSGCRRVLEALESAWARRNERNAGEWVCSQDLAIAAGLRFGGRINELDNRTSPERGARFRIERMRRPKGSGKWWYRLAEYPPDWEGTRCFAAGQGVLPGVEAA